MDNVFIYWDNSNIFHEAQCLAKEREEGSDTGNCVRINFDNIFVALDVFYEVITLMEPSRLGFELAFPGKSAELELSLRSSRSQ